MQYIALNATTIIRGGEETQPECVFRARFYHEFKAQDGDFPRLELIENDLADDDNETRLTGWKQFVAWTGAAVASWGLVVVGVAIARALLS